VWTTTCLPSDAEGPGHAEPVGEHADADIDVIGPPGLLDGFARLAARNAATAAATRLR
jgi:hypothetical protein